MKNSNQIYIFQLIRATACILVCIAHIFITKKQNEFLGSNFIALGQIGVGMFFFISGYLIMKSLNSHELRSFVIHRFLRIYPVFCFVSLIAMGISLATHNSGCPGFGRATALAQLLLVSDIFNKCYFLTVQWTLFIEAKFYILAALAFYFSGGNVKKFLSLFYGLVFVSYCLLCLRTGQQVPIATDMGGIMFISLGVLFYLKEKNQLAYEDWYSLNIFVMLFGVLMFFNFTTSDLRLLQSGNFIIGYLLCLGLLTKNFKSNRVVNFFADISFPLYLIHYLGLKLDDFSLIERTFIFSIMVLVSWLIHVLVEKPAIVFSKSVTLQLHKPSFVNKGLKASSHNF